MDRRRPLTAYPAAIDWLNFYFLPGGRITRSSYWLRFALPLLLLDIAVSVAVDPLQFARATLILSGIFLWPWIAVGAKRCHDRDRSGAFLLIVLIPILGPFWLLIELGFLRGTAGSNRFGPDPCQNKMGV